MGAISKTKVGDTYGAWTVIERGPNQGQHPRWNCRCACGTERLIPASRLASGRSKSCGCLRAARGRERAAEAAERRWRASERPIDRVIPGHKHGRLTVLEEVPVTADLPVSYRYWSCRCECGNLRAVRADKLCYIKEVISKKTGKPRRKLIGTRSCGCLSVEALKREIRRYESMLAKAEDRLALTAQGDGFDVPESALRMAELAAAKAKAEPTAS